MKKQHDVIALPAMIERHFRVAGVQPHSRETYKGLDIYFAQGGPFFDSRGVMQLSEMDAWMHDGYYVSVYAIQKGRQVLVQPLYFRFNHDLELIPAGRVKVRIDAARKQAHDWIEMGIAQGLYQPLVA